jgi:3-hydroxyisobutyrate dehydrogenase-like beta-hydroxyacid dehydrogenase
MSPQKGAFGHGKSFIHRFGSNGLSNGGHLAKERWPRRHGFQSNFFKAEAWVAQYGGRSASSPAAAAEGADFVFTCVGNDDDLRSVTISPQGAFAGMKRGAIYIDNTTASADVARELDALARAKGFASLDAPVSGGQAGAENGQLTVMVGGDPEAFDRAKPIIDSFAKMVGLMVRPDPDSSQRW